MEFTQNQSRSEIELTNIIEIELNSFEFEINWK